MPIRFENLPKLLNSMEEKHYIIDSFPFWYKNEKYIVILKTFAETERKPDQYAKVKLEFIRSSKSNESIHAYADFFEVRFNSVQEFVEFFKIPQGDANRDLFLDFSDIFKKCIPSRKIIEKEDEQIRNLQGSRAEGNNPNDLYCFDVRRNGTRDGITNKRSIENSNKAETLRPLLYKKYKDDKNLSFFFSDNPSEEKTDEEIINIFANRRK